MPQTGHQTSSRAPAARRGLTALDADLEVVSSTWALRLRLGIAVVLGSVLTGIGVVVAFDFVEYASAGTLSDFGRPLGPVIGGVVCIALGLIVFAGGWASFRAYRRRGLI